MKTRLRENWLLAFTLLELLFACCYILIRGHIYGYRNGLIYSLIFLYNTIIPFAVFTWLAFALIVIGGFLAFALFASRRALVKIKWTVAPALLACIIMTIISIDTFFSLWIFPVASISTHQHTYHLAHVQRFMGSSGSNDFYLFKCGRLGLFCRPIKAVAPSTLYGNPFTWTSEKIVLGVDPAESILYILSDGEIVYQLELGP